MILCVFSQCVFFVSFLSQMALCIRTQSTSYRCLSALGFRGPSMWLCLLGPPHVLPIRLPVMDSGLSTAPPPAFPCSHL